MPHDFGYFRNHLERHRLRGRFAGQGAYPVSQPTLSPMRVNLTSNAPVSQGAAEHLPSALLDSCNSNPSLRDGPASGSRCATSTPPSPCRAHGRGGRPEGRRRSPSMDRRETDAITGRLDCVEPSRKICRTVSSMALLTSCFQGCPNRSDLPFRRMLVPQVVPAPNSAIVVGSSGSLDNSTSLTRDLPSRPPKVFRKKNRRAASL